jgi:hypothetical protein
MFRERKFEFYSERARRISKKRDTFRVECDFLLISQGRFYFLHGIFTFYMHGCSTFRSQKLNNFTLTEYFTLSHRMYKMYKTTQKM